MLILTRSTWSQLILTGSCLVKPADPTNFIYHKYRSIKSFDYGQASSRITSPTTEMHIPVNRIAFNGPSIGQVEV